MGREAVDLERIRHDAVLVIIRLGLGPYTLSGPGQNVLEPESRVVWATVANELSGEGYTMVSPEEYAAASGITVEEVLMRVWHEGTLFALAYGAGEEKGLLVPLPEKEDLLSPIEGN